MVFKGGLSKSLRSALYMGVGLVGLGLIVDYSVAAMTPVTESLVNNLGLSLNVIDIGYGNVSAAWAWPVSYTHLDVYKRQYLYRRFFVVLSKKQLLPFVFLQIFFMLVLMMYMRELELYPKDLAMFFVFLLMVVQTLTVDFIFVRFWLCLLYTSRCV